MMHTQKNHYKILYLHLTKREERGERQTKRKKEKECEGIK